MSIAEANHNARIAHVNSAFTPAELDLIEQYGGGLLFAKAKVVHPQGQSAMAPARPGDRPRNSQYDSMRVTNVADIPRAPESDWLYQRMTQVVAFLNQTYQFALNGYFENFQYMVYHHTEGSHFDWHIDQAPPLRRKLSLTVQLSDPSDYENCELQFDDSGTIITAPKNRGVVIAFPSQALHRVTPITAGTRKSLVVWAWEH